MSADGGQPTDGGTQNRTTTPRESGQRTESVKETLSRPESKENLIDVVGMFALVGAGVGLIGALGAGQIPLIGGLFSAFATLAVGFSGPVLAAVFGARLADGMDSDNRSRLITSAAATGGGYIAMTLLAAVLSGAAGLQELNFGDLLVASVMFGAITAAVGIGSTYLSLRDNTIVG